MNSALIYPVKQSGPEILKLADVRVRFLSATTGWDVPGAMPTHSMASTCRYGPVKPWASSASRVAVKAPWHNCSWACSNPAAAN